MSSSDKSIHGPPQKQNNRSVASAAVVQSDFDVGCNNTVTTLRPGAKANSKTLHIGNYGRLDEASLRIIEGALVERVSPLALSLAALAKDKRGVNRAGLAFSIEIYGSIRAAMDRIRDEATAQRPFKLDHLDSSNVKIRRNGKLAPETRMILDDAIFAALAPLVTSRELRSAIGSGDDDVIAYDLEQAIRDIVWAAHFDAIQAGGRANG
jgi:hypothetical protein